MSANKKIAIHTLGCKLNFAESSFLLDKFREKDYEIVSFNEDADIYVIHSCTVTATADKKTRQIINKVKNAKPTAQIALIGCMVDNL
ncbi:MAG: tRNA (N(6)-L-threonylcarbamoyladenosine(37)-C(2))-methylthiotransferase MtaB, partial [Bacteroidales bacterium]|nr:tRNA (N(6)-L-threonylcarbamoyladenosine(37)-C(2))-methylthiotransferase MtaB [Bacteroidales bacterium]